MLMKGIVLAGGLGKRLRSLTQITNKHLLPIYDRPMIFYPIQTLVDAGITDIQVVTGGNNAGDFLRLLGNGEAFGLRHLDYTYQRGEGGIAEALHLAEDFADGQPIIVILGDNILERSIRPFVERFKAQGAGGKILLKQVEDPWRFGVAELSKDKIVRIVEKPKKPVSDLIVTGVYMYDARVFEIIKTLKPSARGELEITDITRLYLEKGELEAEVVQGEWIDAGTFESLHRASNVIREYKLGIRSKKSELKLDLTVPSIETARPRPKKLTS